MSEYIQEFQSTEDVIREYEAPADALSGAVVYLAWYGYGCYEGYSMVLYEKNGVLYEVNGSHCSCHGLEGQWEPEVTSWEALAMRNLVDSYVDGSSEADARLKELVAAHLPKPPATSGSPSG